LKGGYSFSKNRIKGGIRLFKDFGFKNEEEVVMREPMPNERNASLDGIQVLKYLDEIIRKAITNHGIYRQWLKDVPAFTSFLLYLLI